MVWRVVSSDSHPIEGTFAFTATAGCGGLDGGAAVPTLGTPQPGETQAPGTVRDSSEPFPWSIVVFSAVALGLLITLGVLARRRLGISDGDEPETAAGAPGSSGGARSESRWLERPGKLPVSTDGTLSG